MRLNVSPSPPPTHIRVAKGKSTKFPDHEFVAQACNFLRTCKHEHVIAEPGKGERPLAG